MNEPEEIIIVNDNEEINTTHSDLFVDAIVNEDSANLKSS
jgi:hypothetical protein